MAALDTISLALGWSLVIALGLILIVPASVLSFIEWRDGRRRKPAIEAGRG